MKKKFFWLSTICIALLTNSCHKSLKDINAYFPKITTVSATIQSNGTLLLQGNIDSQGNDPVEYAGFCYSSTSTVPKMPDNQSIATINGNTFSAAYPCTAFNVNSTYYFRSWANNGYGYVYGNVIRVDSIIAPAVTPPCSHPANSVNIGASTGTYTYSSVSAPAYSMGVWEVNATTGSGPDVTYDFGSALTTGIYTTTLNTSPAPGQVYVSFSDGFISGALNSGTGVYVNTTGPNMYNVVICNAPWLYNSTTNYFYTNMTVPH